MENNLSVQTQFETECKRIYDVLKKHFLDKMKVATDKEYAYNHYKMVYFEKNYSLAHNTVFFEELKAVFTHFKKVDQKNAVKQTLLSLSKIRKDSKQAEIQAFSVSYSNPNYDIFQLPLWYQHGITNDGCSLDDLMEKESKLLTLTEQEIIKLLAFYHVTQQLLVDVEKFYALEPKEDLPTGKHKHQFTKSQIVIMAHYIFEMAGINRSKVDVTSCAEVLHCMLGVPYDKIANSDIYKKMLKPFSNTSPKKTVEDLKLVRSYLAKFHNQKILDSIDQQIARLSK